MRIVMSAGEVFGSGRRARSSTDSAVFCGRNAALLAYMVRSVVTASRCALVRGLLGDMVILVGR